MTKNDAPALLDVNVLIALLDANHIHHEPAHAWFAGARRQPWATCPLTINGCVRILTGKTYPFTGKTAHDVIASLSAMCSSSHHQFWADSVSLLDAKVFKPDSMQSSKITDIYLLGLAVQQGGRLVTFDRSISTLTVVGGGTKHLKILA